jgi:amino acid adenylation domain-containing protein
MRDQLMIAEDTSDGGMLSRLPEVLPQDPRAAGARQLVFALDDAQRDALTAWLARTGAQPHEALAAALLLAEARLTGDDPAYPAFATGEGTRARRAPVVPGHRFVDWLTALRGAQQDRHADAVWMVATPDAPLAAGQGAACWCLTMAPEASIEVAFDAPWSVDGISLLTGCAIRALVAMASDDDCTLAAIDPVDADALRRDLDAWNDTALPRSPAETVHGRFLAIAQEHADAPAVIAGDLALSYRELRAHAAAVANMLRSAGVAPGDAVAIAMPRSAAAVVAALAVLEAGAAYLPLDPHHPCDRLAFMLQDAGARFVLCLPGDPLAALPATVTRIEVSLPRTPSAETHAPEAIVDGDALAYVMYTSGSTGLPKGVEIRHRSILRLAIGNGFMQVGSGARVLHAAPLGFDASTLELWGPLLNGGCIVVHEEALPTGAGLAETIGRHGVTGAWLTAALFNAVVDEDPRRLAGLRELITGGEALSATHVRRMQAAAPALQLRNGYGPTECTTFTTTYDIPPDLPQDATSIPIGRPIADTRLYVLNARGQPLPAGVVGELFVAGEGLARGYLGRPELTAERFVQASFDPRYGATERLYRTGDHVRRHADGVIEFVGRVDDQVKIRGFRIELQEIEAALATHSQVRACAVLARADTPGEKRLVAYVVSDAAPPPAHALRTHLAARLPDYMVPARYVLLDALPVTGNGKLDRKALPAPDRTRPELAAAFETPADALEAAVCIAFARLLDLEEVGRQDSFFELGGNSLLAVRLVEALRGDPALQKALAGDENWRTRLEATLPFRHPTPASLAAALRADASGVDPARISRGRRDKGEMSVGESPADEPIAIVAMAGRFPGAADVEAFWQNLCEGRESITRFAPEDLDPSIPAAERADPNYVPARGVIDGVEDFDAGFFGISAREAELMDPQQRIFLELCWECLERAGHVPDAAGTPVGVFAGMYNATYYQRHLAPRPDLIARLGAFQVMLDNEKDYIATRVAHKLDLTGPAVSVHTACSTSLVAICQAIDSLRAGRCGMALAGGASVTCPPRSGYRYEEGAMLSPDGSTRSFDADAQGTVFSDGAAVVLLKRLSDAIADGNPIYAVLRGAAVNNDGARKASFTAPSAEAQAAVVAMAHADAGIDPAQVSYVEAHGTATPLGDPIEIEGLRKAFAGCPAEAPKCRIGSVKSNVGHLVIAAGAAGVIKTALSLHERRIPASLHFRRANPALGLERSPFVVNDAMHAWDVETAPRVAGVSSFGVGGTNAHVVLQEAPELPASEPAQGPQLLVLSARSPAALAQSASRLADQLQAEPDTNLADVAWTLAVGRKAFVHRLSICASDVADAVAQLRDAASRRAELAPLPTSPETPERSKLRSTGGVVFLFPGQGAQYAGMGRALYAAEPAFRAAFDECADALLDELGFDLRHLVFGDDADALLPTAVMQPAIFAVEYSLARLWLDLGIRPAAMAGHSVGEFVAATLAGVFALPDALRLVARRGRLMQAQPPGGMLSVRLPFAQVAERLPDTLSLAAENAPGSCVVAGPFDALSAFQSRLEGEGVACRALRTSHAFHSSMMDDVVAPFRAEVEAVARSAPAGLFDATPIMSTVSADWLDADTARSPDYWARHLREPVRFAPALAHLLADGAGVLLEVGPRATLSTLARQQSLGRSGAAAVASLADAADNELATFRAAAGQLWCRGLVLDPAAFDRRARRRRLRLPAYPFERRRYWVEAAGASAAAPPAIDLQPATATAAAMESEMPQAQALPAAAPPSRVPRLIAQLRTIFEDVAGFDIEESDAGANFIELGLDSLMLTQVALQLQKQFPVKITFRQLMGDCASLERLAGRLDTELPSEAAAAGPQSIGQAQATPSAPAMPIPPSAAMPAAMPMPLPTMAGAGDGDFARQLIAQQMQLMSQQLALLSGQPSAPGAPGAPVAPAVAPAPPPATANVHSIGSGTSQPTFASAPTPGTAPAPAEDEEAALAHTKYDVKKAFGAIARIDNGAKFELNPLQRARLDAFVERYTARTAKSKAYTAQHRPHMADPRVVNGFRPLLKEITYQIVIERSKGAHLTDLDGNDYVDALNGFGMSLFGWQPDFVLDAVKEQLELGYEIGPQHPLAGEVAQRVCAVTGHDRSALCNTGSEAVLGALRIARTVTGRETVVLFTGAYHGIIDEMIVRGTKKLRAVPAAPGILRNTAEHVLVLDYGTPESMAIIRERIDEIAAVLVEPVQSRRPDFRPVEFLRELREVTEKSGALLVFDEVVTGFRAHPAGAQGLFGIRADLATYGKVVGGGYPIGVIAGKRRYMDALDGGQWEFGDDSVPTVGVTYFAGTFVRHPLALAAANAVLRHIQDQGPAMQEALNRRVSAMAAELNAFCADVGAPIEVRHFASVWKTFFLEEHPLQDLLFAMMRSRGVHILDNFPCFFTTAHAEADFQRITDAFKQSVIELQESEFLPRRATAHTVMDPAKPAVPGARLGRDPEGRPAWFVPNPDAPGKYLKVG